MQNTAQMTVLPNGIRVATDSAPHFETVAIQVAFQVGSVHDGPGKAGMAHLLEHLMFRGSHTRSGTEIQTAFEGIGGQLNATTDEDSTIYKAHVLHEDTGLALDVIGDMVTRPLIQPEDITLEKQIIEQENCRGCWGCTMREGLYEAAYPGHPASQPIIGTSKSIAGITREDLLAHHKATYTTKALVVSVAGNVDHDTVVRQVDAAFGDLPNAPAMQAPPLRFEPGEMFFGDTSDQGVIRVVYPAATGLTREDRAEYAWIDIVGGHANCLLMQELREERGLVYGIWGETDGILDAAEHVFEMRGDAEQMTEICEVFSAVLQESARQIALSEVAAHQKRFVARTRMGLDHVNERVGRLTREVIYDGAPTDLAERIDVYLSLTDAEIAAAGARVLDRDPVLLSSGPMREMPRIPAIRSMLKGGAPAADKKRFRLFG